MAAISRAVAGRRKSAEVPGTSSALRRPTGTSTKTSNKHREGTGCLQGHEAGGTALRLYFHPPCRGTWDGRSWRNCGAARSLHRSRHVKARRINRRQEGGSQ
jgi:hypothetical protein